MKITALQNIHSLTKKLQLELGKQAFEKMYGGELAIRDVELLTEKMLDNRYEALVNKHPIYTLLSKQIPSFLFDIAATKAKQVPKYKQPTKKVTAYGLSFELVYFLAVLDNGINESLAGVPYSYFIYKNNKDVTSDIEAILTFCDYGDEVFNFSVLLL